MSHALDGASHAARTVIVAVLKLSTERSPPLLIALDGPSGAGKSVLAVEIATALDATVVPSDDFFAAQISDAGWEARWDAAEAHYSTFVWRPELFDVVASTAGTRL